MLPSMTPAALALLLPFFIEGARGALPDPEFSPTADPAPLPSASPILLLQNIDSPLTTCTFENIAWSYGGSSARLTITVTNFGVPQGPPPISSSPSPAVDIFTDNGVVRTLRPRGPDTITNIIVGNLEASELHVPWTVNVPSGWYNVVAMIGSQRLDQTDAFFVQNGPDTSCLVGGPTSSSTSSTSASTSSTSMANTAPPAPQETASPATPVASTSKDNHVGVIIGVVAGAVVALIIILIAFLFLRRRKHAAQDRPDSVLPGAGLHRGWGGLGSFSSIHAIKPGPTPRDLAAATRELARHTEEVASRSDNSTSFSLEEKVSTSPVSNYKNPFDETEGGITLATLPPNGRRSSSARSSLQPSPTRHNPSINAIVTSYDREASIRSTDMSSSPHNTLATAEMTPSYSTSSFSASPVERNKAKRDSTGSQMAVRKTTRKPVPTYDPALHTSSTPSPFVENASPIALTPGTSTGASLISSQGHYSKKAQLNASIPEDINALPRKSSFGPGGIEGKPVHYLIPDMPLPRTN